MIDESQAELLAEQLKHTIDLIKADLKMANHRIEQLEKAREDQETRIRILTDGVTSFKVWSGLANGGSSLVAIFALLRSFFSG